MQLATNHFGPVDLYNDRSPRFLITRLSHVGDCILTIPIACALRERFPNALIAWVVEKPSDQLLRRHHAIDELIVLQRGWLKSPKRLAELGRQLKSLQFEVTIDPQSLTKSAVIARCSGAKQRLGLARPLGRELAPALNNQLIRPEQPHVVDRSLELLKPLGITQPAVRFELPTDAASDREIVRFINDAAPWSAVSPPSILGLDGDRGCGRLGASVRWHASWANGTGCQAL